MAPRRRKGAGLSRKLLKAKKNCLRRESESSQEKTLRLDDLKYRTSSYIMSETPEEREQRLQVKKERASLARQNETPEERDTRLKYKKQRTSSSIQKETPQQRDKRLKDMRQRTSSSKQKETPQQRDKRLKDKRQRTSSSRQKETPEDKETRLRENIHRATATHDVIETYQGAPRRKNVRRKSLFMTTVKAAFKYDPALPYQNDTAVSIGQMDNKCSYCQALKFNNESEGICCSGGKVQIPMLDTPPPLLAELLSGVTSNSKNFLSKIRKYNSAFQMTSFGVCTEVAHTGFMPTFKIQGQIYHRIGSLFPNTTSEPHKFLQIYFMGDSEKECDRRCELFEDLDRYIISSLQDLFHSENSLVRGFKTVLDNMPTLQEFKVVISAEHRPAGEHAKRYNAPEVEEVAIILAGEPSNPRDIVIQTHGNEMHTVFETHRSYDGLQYPLIYWSGQDGYFFPIYKVDPKTKTSVAGKISCTDFYAYLIMEREGITNYIFLYRELFLQFLVDMYAKVESERLRYIKANQNKLRVESYIHLQDEISAGVDPNNIGRITILPSSFTGSPRYMHEKSQDALCYVRKFGRPDLFITFTCNPKSDEILRELKEGQKPHHRPDIISRVFHAKVVTLIRLFKHYKIFGPLRAYLYTVEYQKRGLPHIHSLLWLEEKLTPDQIDEVICAELPDPTVDPELYEIIKSCNVHGPCGPYNKSLSCMKDGKCSKKYPKQYLAETQTGEDGYPNYRRRMPNQGGHDGHIAVGRSRVIIVDNRWIVPYCPLLSKILKSHVNVEYCNSVKAIKYICKYVHKGTDAAMVALQNVDKRDEVTLYQSARYISSSEAAWRLLKFPIHDRSHAVVHLDVHLENGQRVYFNPAHEILPFKDTTLTAFFRLCSEDEFAQTLLYNEVPRFYVWDSRGKKWNRRKRGTDEAGYPGIKSDEAIGRVYTVNPANHECFHLRLLLHKVKGPKSFQDIKIIRGQHCSSFREACQLLGLLEDDNQWDATLSEAETAKSAFQMRSLFAIMLHCCGISDPMNLWLKYRVSLTEDIQKKLMEENPFLQVSSNDQIFKEGLILIEDQVLKIGGTLLESYGLPSSNRNDHGHDQDIIRETSYNINPIFVKDTESRLLDEQKKVYCTISKSITHGMGGIFFIDSPGGTGKTFLLNLLLSKSRWENKIALAVASSGIASTLLQGGRTAHSTFKLPLDLTKQETPVCAITKQSARGKLLRNTELIVWDECTMSHKQAFEAVDRTLQDLRNSELLFGGVTIVLAGDFRQTLPVIPRGTKADELKACLKNSYIWDSVVKLKLSTNMRAHVFGDESAEDFSKRLMSIGDGLLNRDIKRNLHILPCGEIALNIPHLIDNVFPNLNENISDTNWLCERAILAPRNDAVDAINLILLDRMPGIPSQFKSIDTVVDQSDVVEYPAEFLNSLKPSGMPPHNLLLKTGAPIMMLRNLDPPRLCNGTRLVIKTMQNYVIEATIITGEYRGKTVFIPRIPILHAEAPEFKRLQFPIRLSFAITINKSQGQTLKVVGLNLEKNCFAHGQLYVGCSRVGDGKNLFIYSSEMCLTENVVYQEALIDKKPKPYVRKSIVTRSAKHIHDTEPLTDKQTNSSPTIEKKLKPSVHKSVVIRPSERPIPKECTSLIKHRKETSKRPIPKECHLIKRRKKEVDTSIDILQEKYNAILGFIPDVEECTNQNPMPLSDPMYNAIVNIALQHGFIPINVKSDGSCFFHAVSVCLRCLNVYKGSGVEIKGRTLQFMRHEENKNYYLDFFTEDVGEAPEVESLTRNEREENYERLLRNVELGEYADNLFTQAVSDLLKINIRTFHSVDANRVFFAVPRSGPSGITVTVGNINQVHYVSFVPNPTEHIDTHGVISI